MSGFLLFISSNGRCRGRGRTLAVRCAAGDGRLGCRSSRGRTVASGCPG